MNVDGLKVWVVKYGEVVPFGSAGQGKHYFRSAELSRRLVARNHQVTWWTGRFEHQTKRHLTDGVSIEIPGGTGSKVVLLDSPGYRSNMSLQRFYDHYRMGSRFRAAIQGAEKPDVIVASMPTPELARASADYAIRHGVPLIVDVRDLWPDAILDRLQSRIGFVPPGLFYPYERDVKFSLANADSVTAITHDCLTWAQDKSHRPTARRSADKVFHLASRRLTVSAERLQKFADVWRDRGLNLGPDMRTFAWAGSLTDQRATRALLEAQSLLSPDIAARIQVVICGKGDLESLVSNVAERHRHVIYPGFLDREEIEFLYRNSDVGLLCYDNTRDFRSSFPNKFGEYLMNGLQVLTTIDGAMQRSYGQEGFIVTAEANAGAIAAAMSRLAVEPKNPALAEKARAVFERDFDSEIVYEAFCDHIERLAASDRPSSKFVIGTE